MARRQMVTLEGALCHGRTTLARALAEAALTGFDNASEEGRALTQLQQVDVLTLAFDTYLVAVQKLRACLEGEAFIAEILRRSDDAEGSHVD